MRKWAKATLIRLFLSGLLVIGLLSPVPRGWADFLGTVPGSGTNFASVAITVASVAAQYTANLICDPVAGKAQCGGVNASNEQLVHDAATLAAIQAAISAGTNTIGNVGQVYPAGSTPITATATGTTAATTATLAANATLHTYICGFSIRANATAAATAEATVTGVVTATMNFLQWTAPAASGIGVTEEIFSPCIISSATNTAIAVVSAAPGTAGVVSVSAWGYQL